MSLKIGDPSINFFECDFIHCFLDVQGRSPGLLLSCQRTQDGSSDVAYFLQKGDELRREGSYQEAIEVRKIGKGGDLVKPKDLAASALENGHLTS